MDAFLDCVFFFDFKPFFKKVIVNLSFYCNAFVAFLRRLFPPSSKLAYVYLFKVSRNVIVSSQCSTANYILNCTVFILELLFLPRKGYKTITVTEKIHKDIKKRAEEANLTLKQYVEYLFAEDKAAKGA